MASMVHNFIRGCTARYHGFTLIELMVVISIISLLMGILVPALLKASQRAKTIVGMKNQRQITDSLSLFTNDNDESYPESVATIGFNNNWHWQDPRMVVGYNKRTPQIHRAISEYLGSYVGDADIFVCPLAPHKYKFLQESWDAGDNWDNPETAPIPDPFFGSYCFFWNYVGYRGVNKPLFKGPRSPVASRWIESTLLMSCYFGYNHWRSPLSFGSCEKISGSAIIPETFVSSTYWAVKSSNPQEKPKVTLNAAYTDGHVESYLSSDTVPMEVSITPDGSTPYPAAVGPGIFFLPSNAVR